MLDSSKIHKVHLIKFMTTRRDIKRDLLPPMQIADMCLRYAQLPNNLFYTAVVLQSNFKWSLEPNEVLAVNILPLISFH